MANLTARALAWKYPTVNFDTVDDRITAWRSSDVKQPDEIETKAVVDEYVAFKARNLYKERRKNEYPPLEDFSDAVFHERNGNAAPMEAYLAAVQAVKNKYPKPE